MSASYKKLKKFLSFYEPYRLLLFADIICASITVLASLALPLCIRYLTVNGPELEPREASLLVFRTVLAMLALILVQVFCGIFYDYKGHAMGAMMERDMRNELFRHCQRLPVHFFDRQRTGSLMSRISGDLEDMAEFCHHGPENLFIFLSTFIGAFVILFRIDARLTLVTFAFLPLLIIYTVFFQGRLRKAYRENRENIAELNADLEDTLSGIRVVKSFTNEKMEDEKFRVANESFCRGRRNIYRNEAFYYSAMEYFFAPLVIVGAVAAGGILISRSVLSASDLIVFLLYIGYLTSPLTRIAQWVGQFQDAMAGFTRFMEIIDIETERFSNSENVVIQRFKGHIEFVNASFKYGEALENVFENITLDVGAGTSIALVGSSGVGKTTLCSLIPMFYELNSGKILLDGRDIREIDLETLRQNIGLVAQDVYLFNGTVIENIAYGKPTASHEEIIQAAKMAKAHDFIMELPDAYETKIGQRGIRLSGGQRQRLSIARAFLKDPPVLILDEATSALDYENENAIHESLDSFIKNRTVFIIAHRLSTVKKAGRVFRLSERGIEETNNYGDDDVI
jgi:ATP-binding cassette, subfamily B, bacterial